MGPEITRSKMLLRLSDQQQQLAKIDQQRAATDVHNLEHRQAILGDIMAKANAAASQTLAEGEVDPAMWAMYRSSGRQIERLSANDEARIGGARKVLEIQNARLIEVQKNRKVAQVYSDRLGQQVRMQGERSDSQEADEVYVSKMVSRRAETSEKD